MTAPAGYRAALTGADVAVHLAAVTGKAPRTEYGRVNVNTDPAGDLAMVLHLDPKDADAIVGFRKQHGKFADFAALSAVPGIVLEAFQKRRDAIVF